MGKEVHTVSVSLQGMKKWMWRKRLGGFFSVDGRTLTDSEVRKVVEYGISKGYDTNKDISDAEVNGWERVIVMKEEGVLLEELSETIERMRDEVCGLVFHIVSTKDIGMADRFAGLKDNMGWILKHIRPSMNGKREYLGKFKADMEYVARVSNTWEG